MCEHKAVFPILPLEIEGTFVMIVLLTLAVLSGVGGGGIVVPMLMSYFMIGMKEAIVISGFTIVVGSVTRYFSILKAKHPEKDAVLIEYGLTNVMLPCVLVGSNLGVFFNLIMPQIILIICLTSLLGSMSIHSFFKAKEIWQKESQSKKTNK